MTKREDGAYVLGTHDEEHYRLGLQHQVWAEEAQMGWASAGFGAGDHLLDLGCGPGFCTKELAFIAGPSGKVTGVDLSQKYINHLKQVSDLHKLNIEGLVADFIEMQLEANSLDGAYCRWALAWHNEPKAVLQKVKTALKPGAKMVAQEYIQWFTTETIPAKPELAHCIAACMKSLQDPPGDINVGRDLVKIFSELDMKVTSVRLMPKIGRPKSLAWTWQKTFYEVYFRELVKNGYLTESERVAGMEAFSVLESDPNTLVIGPTMVEVIAEK